MEMDWYLLLGVIGASLILLGFVRVNSGRWGNKSLWYELDNLVGAACIGIYNFHHQAYATLVLNIVWVFVAIRGLESLAARRTRAKAHKTKIKRKK